MSVDEHAAKVAFSKCYEILFPTEPGPHEIFDTIAWVIDNHPKPNFLERKMYHDVLSLARATDFGRLRLVDVSIAVGHLKNHWKYRNIITQRLVPLIASIQKKNFLLTIMCHVLSKLSLDRQKQLYDCLGVLVKYCEPLAVSGRWPKKTMNVNTLQWKCLDDDTSSLPDAPAIAPHAAKKARRATQRTKRSAEDE